MFKSDLILIAATGRPDIWYLGGPLIWTADGLTITVPAGFITDLASIPHIVDAIPDLDRTGLSRRPGALHDWLYGGARWITKPVADDLLYAALLAEGMDKNGATAIYEGVHLFGRSSWESDGAKVMAANFDTRDHYLAWLATGPRLNPAG